MKVTRTVWDGGKLQRVTYRHKKVILKARPFDSKETAISAVLKIQEMQLL